LSHIPLAAKPLTKCSSTTKSKPFLGAALKPPKAVPREGATVTTRFGPNGITICNPNRANEGAGKVFQKIYDRAI